MEEHVAKAIKKMGVRRVAEALGVSREAALALAVGVAQPGSQALARENMGRLERVLEVGAVR